MKGLTAGHSFRRPPRREVDITAGAAAFSTADIAGLLLSEKSKEGYG
jgi:hypothetical protein